MSERVYCPGPASFADGADALVVDGDEGRHLGRVRRIRVGQTVEVFDGRGLSRRAEVVEVLQDRVTLRPVGPPLPDRAPTIELTLATAVPKGDRFDWLVEKASELGVSALAPVLTERSVVDPRAGKLDRLGRLAIEAAKQCGRNRVMTIGRPTPWPNYLRDGPRDRPRLIAHPGGLAFPTWPKPCSSAAVVAVGPEGGFTDAEVDLAVSLGWVAVSLGSTILRVETAGLVASARLLALAEQASV